MGRPSRTSQVVALHRARLDRPVSADGDPRAQSLLCRGMAPAQVPALAAHLAARTRFVDDALIAAIRAGVRQVVILGAGYDDRALRFRTDGVRFFELDHQDTQRDKRTRLARIGSPPTGPVLGVADFRSDDVTAVLRQAGHDPAPATLFICEGLLVYLDAPTIINLLSSLRACAAPGSRLAASLAVHADGLDSAAIVAERNAGRRTADAEPWRTILPVDEHCQLLRDAGWEPRTTLDDHELEPAASAGRSLLVQADPVY